MPAATDEELAELGLDPVPTNVVPIAKRKPAPKPEQNRPPFKEWSLAEIDALPETAYLIGDEDHPILLEGALWQTLGKLKSAKTFYCVELAFCVAFGLQFEGFKAVEGNVAYVIAEGTIKRNAQRVKALCWKYADQLRVKLGVPEEMTTDELVTVAMNAGKFNLINNPIALAALSENDPNGPKAFLAQLAHRPYKLVVLDTWARALWAAGGHDSDAQVVGPSIQACDRIRAALDCTLIMVAHVGVAASAQGRAKGLSDPAGAVDGATLCHKTGSGPEAVFEFTATYQRFAVDGFALSAKLRKMGPNVTLQYISELTNAGGKGKLEPNQERVLDILRGLPPGTSKAKWREAIKAAKVFGGKPNSVRTAFRRALAALETADRIAIVGDMVTINDDPRDDFPAEDGAPIE